MDSSVPLRAIWSYRVVSGQSRNNENGLRRFSTRDVGDGMLGIQCTHGRDKTVARTKTDSARGNQHRRVASSSRLVSRKYLPAEGGA